MEVNEIIGIDASKLTLDCCIHSNGKQEVFENNPEGINRLLDWVSSQVPVKKEQILFVFENTGLYTIELIDGLQERRFLMYVASGLEIRRSLGIARGKDDKADAKRIALYGYRIREDIEPYSPPSKALVKLKRLMSIRRKLVVQHAG